MANINIQIDDNVHMDFKSTIARWGRLAQIKTVIPFILHFVVQNPEMFKKAFEEWIKNRSRNAA